MINFSCPKCGKPYRIDEAQAGKKGKCSKCGLGFRVPATSAVSEAGLTVADSVPEDTPTPITAQPASSAPPPSLPSKRPIAIAGIVMAGLAVIAVIIAILASGGQPERGEEPVVRSQAKEKPAVQPGPVEPAPRPEPTPEPQPEPAPQPTPEPTPDAPALSSAYKPVRSEGAYTYKGVKYWREIEHEKSGIVLRLVPAGEFDMGSHISPEEVARKYGGEAGWFKYEHPLHKVKISKPFYIGKYEVTNEQYCKFLNAKAAHSGGGNIWLYCETLDDIYKYCGIEKRGGEYRPKNWRYEGKPVVMVSWWGAKAFSEWMGGRLPSEAEWEYACRAGTKTPFNTGNNITTDQANYDGRFPGVGNPKGEYRTITTPVGTFNPNAWGLYDMHGNVAEWCEDVWHDNYNGAPGDGSAWTSGGEQSDRVCRGGSRNASVWSTRSADRNGSDPGPGYTLGFRVALSASADR